MQMKAALFPVVAVVVFYVHLNGVRYRLPVSYATISLWPFNYLLSVKRYFCAWLLFTDVHVECVSLKIIAASSFEEVPCYARVLCHAF